MKTTIEIIDEMLAYFDMENSIYKYKTISVIMFKSIIHKLKERMEKECGWISVKDRLPTPKRRYSDEVICYIQENKGIVMAYYDSTDGDWGGESLLFL